MLVSGCAAEKVSHPEIIPDISSCSECGMLISDIRFAAYLKSERIEIFDDVGCMATFVISNQIQPEIIEVKDYDNSEWIHATEAVFIKTKSIRTPMNYNFTAFKKESSFLNHLQTENISWKGNWKELLSAFETGKEGSL